MKGKKIMYIALILLAITAALITWYMNQPKFGRAPRGARLARIERSPNYRDGKFHNLHPTPQIVSDKGRLRVMLDFIFEKRDNNRPANPVPAIKSELRNFSINNDVLVWFGHSSYLIQSGGVKLLIDPVLESASPVPFFNKPFKGSDIYKPEDMPEIDYLVITHDHWDHLDYQTVKKLKAKHVVCPLGVGEYFEQWGFDNIIELDWNESSSNDEVAIYCLPARHFSGRTFKTNITLWASFMIKTSTQTIYIGGDGGYDTHFNEIAKRFPVIDVAILENGQYNQDWRYIHLMPNDLAKAVKDLNARRTFTFHNSKYALAKHSWNEPLENAKKLGISMPLIGEIVNTNSEE